MVINQLLFKGGIKRYMGSNLLDVLELVLSCLREAASVLAETQQSSSNIQRGTLVCAVVFHFHNRIIMVAAVLRSKHV